MLRLLLALLLSLCASSGVLAAIGTPTPITSTTLSSTASGSSITTTVDAPVGSLIIVAILSPQSTVTNVTDSAGNSYSKAIASTTTTGYSTSSIWYCNNSSIDLPSGGTITVTLSSGNYYAVAAKTSGAIGGLDLTNTTLVNSTSLSLSTGTLNQSTEVVFGMISNFEGSTSFVESANFTTLVTAYDQANLLDLAYDVVSATTSVTYAPSWTGTVHVSGVIASFCATNCAVSSQSFPLLGVGP